MEFSRQEYWSGLPFLSPGDLPDPGTEPFCLDFPPIRPCVLSGFLSVSLVKNPLANTGDPQEAGNKGSVPGSGRSPGEGKGNPLQDSGLENSLNQIVHGVAKSGM